MRRSIAELRKTTYLLVVIAFVPDSGTIDKKPLWNPITNRGKGKAPKMKYHSDAHTNSLIPLYAKGAGSQLFLQKARYNDPVRGPYLDNTSIAKVVLHLFAY